MSVPYTDKQVQRVRELRESGLDWVDVARSFNAENPNLEPKTPNALRKLYSEHQDIDMTNEPNLIVKTLKRDRRIYQDNSTLAKENRILLDNMLSYEEFLTEISVINQKCPIKLHPKVNLSKKNGVSKRTIVVHISDTHFGCNIIKEEMGGINEYNPTIAARRMAFLANQIVHFKEHKRKETDLKIVLNGDIFAGIIHAQEWGVMPMATQYSIGMRILSPFISYVASKFKEVEVICIGGNHPRFTHKQEKGRVTSMKWDSFETILYTSLKETFKDYQNIKFNIPATPYAKFEVQNHLFFATHGDTVVSSGNTHKSINIEKITNTINSINTSLNEVINVIMLAHVHMASYSQLSNGEKLVINGSLSGADSFTQSMGVLANICSQQIFECSEQHPVGDMRFINVLSADNDSDLDKIIEPPLGLF